MFTSFWLLFIHIKQGCIMLWIFQWILFYFRLEPDRSILGDFLKISNWRGHFLHYFILKKEKKGSVTSIEILLIRLMYTFQPRLRIKRRNIVDNNPHIVLNLITFPQTIDLLKPKSKQTKQRSHFRVEFFSFVVCKLSFRPMWHKGSNSSSRRELSRRRNILMIGSPSDPHGLVNVWWGIVTMPFFIRNKGRGSDRNDTKV